VRTVLVNRLVFTPVPRPAQLSPPKGPGRKPRFVYELRGEGSLSKLFAGLVSASSVVAPTGCAHRTSYSLRRFSPCRLEGKRRENHAHSPPCASQ